MLYNISIPVLLVSTLKEGLVIVLFKNDGLVSYNYIRQRKIFCLIIILVGGFIFPKMSANVFAKESDFFYYWQTLYNNAAEAIRIELVPAIKKLASGNASKITWSFEKSPFYIDDEDEETAKYNFWCDTFNIYALPDALLPDFVGMFNIDDLDFESTVRKMQDKNGNVFYRCALTGLSVKGWFSPNGDVCSKSKALSYYNKCQKQIKAVVKKIRSAKYNGKPLSNELKLKYIHDWLIASVKYDEKGLEEYEKDISKNWYMFHEYGAIVDGKAVCQGYAYAFKAIVDELVRQTGADIECEIASDIEYSHAWNRVKLNGKWYHVDVDGDDDDDDDDFFNKETDTNYFLVSDEALAFFHPGAGGYKSYNSSRKATDHKYEGKKWPRWRKELSECSITIKDSGKLYTNRSIKSSVVLRYGANILPSSTYKVTRVKNKKTGVITVKIIPTKDCYAFSGSISKIVPAKISGVAKTTKHYKLGKSKSVRPFDKKFKPFSIAYKYSRRSTFVKVSSSLTLKSGADYTVSYKNNKKVGWATATITLKGNYSGKVTVKYKITK